MKDTTRGILLMLISTIFLFAGQFFIEIKPIFMWIMGFFMAIGMYLASGKKLA